MGGMLLPGCIFACSVTPIFDPNAPLLHRWRGVLAGPLVAVVTMISALIATSVAGVPLRDPDGVAGGRFVWALMVVAMLMGLDMVIQAGRRSGQIRLSRAAIRHVQRERWTWQRAVAVFSALISFYITYLAYRNLKSVVPLLRPGELFDRQLADIDRSIFGGNDPAALLHDLIGTGLSTEVLSIVYMLFFAFIPLSLAFALVFSPNLQGGLFYVTAQSLNWVLGAASYFLLPSLGPIYVDPPAFGNLAYTEVGRLQEILLSQRFEFLNEPAATGGAQSIAAFASLHVSILFTGVLVAHLLGLARGVKIAVWAMFLLTTVATIHLGWHYVLDDIGGLVIAITAVAVARALTGFDLAAARGRMTAPSPSSLRAPRPATAQPATAQSATAQPAAAQPASPTPV